MRDRIRSLLLAEIQQVAPPSAKGPALQRLLQVAEAFPDFLPILAEPWKTALDKGGEVLAAAADCARIHLYARILDDVLDEGKALQKHFLMAAQPMLWGAIAELAAHFPALRGQMKSLIQETVAAAIEEDRTHAVRLWGPKNHHLLLLPMLLSGDSPGYRICRRGLSVLLALDQARDESRQGYLQAPQQRTACFSMLAAGLKPEILDQLRRHGWHLATERIVQNARLILEREG